MNIVVIVRHSKDHIYVQAKNVVMWPKMLKYHIAQNSGEHLNISILYYQYSESHLDIRRSRDTLIFNMGILNLDRSSLYWDGALVFVVFWHIQNQT